MLETLLRRTRVYLAMAAMAPKEYLAFSIWVWMEFFLQILSMIVFVFFWRAVYSNQGTLGGLNLQQTINYILLAQILVPVVQNRVIFQFGFLIREGGLATELTRPLDFQSAYYVRSLAGMLTNLVTKVPLVLIAVLAFGLQLPSEPAAWGCFAVSLLLGQAVLFFFDWTFSCLAFYTTETWGLSVVREGVAAFFSGSLLPLTMLPGWLQAIGAALPFAQALYVPVSFLSGITPVSQAVQVWTVQLIWLAALWVLSRWAFNRALRVVTVQGG